MIRSAFGEKGRVGFGGSALIYLLSWISDWITIWNQICLTSFHFLILILIIITKTVTVHYVREVSHLSHALSTILRTQISILWYDTQLQACITSSASVSSSAVLSEWVTSASSSGILLLEPLSATAHFWPWTLASASKIQSIERFTPSPLFPFGIVEVKLKIPLESGDCAFFFASFQSYLLLQFQLVLKIEIIVYLNVLEELFFFFFLNLLSTGGMCVHLALQAMWHRALAHLYTYREIIKFPAYRHTIIKYYTPT